VSKLVQEGGFKLVDIRDQIQYDRAKFTDCVVRPRGPVAPPPPSQEVWRHTPRGPPAEPRRWTRVYGEARLVLL
jgi:hypothetical protein